MSRSIDGAPPSTSSASTLAELIERSQQGDTSAMEQIYGRFKKALFGLAYRHTYNRATAEDLLQDIFVKIFTNIDDVDRPETFTGWVYRIALNTCYSHLRGHRIEIERSVPLDDVEGVLRQNGDEEASHEIRRPLEEAVRQLPPKLRQIFLLHDVQGFKHEEIGRMMRLSAGTSKSQLFKARLKIRGFLKDRGVC